MTAMGAERSDAAVARTPKHTRVATISPADRAAAVQALQDVQADWVEVRFDALWDASVDGDRVADDLIAITEAASVPLLATLRPSRQGGRFDGDEELRIGLLLAAARAGCHVDLEDDNEHIGAVMSPFREAGAKVVLSDHRFREAPSREVGLRHLQSMQDQGPAYDKIAFPCGSFMDGLRALELAHGHAHRSGRPCIAPLGGDAMLRALLPLAGNHATYGHIDGPAVPGQPSMAEIQEFWDHWGLAQDDLPGDAEAGWYAVIGHPVGHSLSPRIHNAMLRHAGRPERYGALDVPDSLGAVRLLTGVAHRIGLRGCSVTMPLKQHAYLVCRPDDLATAAGAVNCMRFTARGEEGTNTDASAMQRLLAQQDPGSVAVIGAGGAARAAIAAAQALDIDVSFTSRDPGRAAQLAQASGATWFPWDQQDDLRADAWIQATPATDIAPAGLREARYGIELVYAEAPTAFEAAIPKTTDGRTFLIEQALDAYRYWTGQDAERAIMEAAL